VTRVAWRRVRVVVGFLLLLRVKNINKKIND
jgi:hypothetical protein